MPQGINNPQNDTTAIGTGTANNSSYDDLLAIWDTHNPAPPDGTPSSWKGNNYWSATPSASGHAYLHLPTGKAGDIDDTFNFWVALQVL